MLFADIFLTTVNRAVLHAQSFYIQVSMVNIFRCTAWNRNKVKHILFPTTEAHSAIKPKLITI